MTLTDPYLTTLINICIALATTAGFLIYRYIYPKKTVNLFLLLLIITIIPILSLFRDGTFRAGDLRAHTAQLIDFYYNLHEGVLFPQWAGDLCGGYGCPVYEIEYILPYYVASFFHVIGFSFLTSLKLVLASSFIASGITMYLWAKEEFGNMPGFTAAIFYLFAPYHLIDLHFRASIGEVLSFVFIPLLFLFCKRLTETKKTKYFFLEAFTVLFILLSHSSTTLITIPLTIIYGIVLWLRGKNKNILRLLLPSFSIFYGILLSTYYWLPALHDVQYTWWRFTTYGDFKPFWEYIYSPIAYGFLFQGHQGEYRLIIGYPQLLAILVAIYLLFKNKIDKKFKLFLKMLLVCFFLLFFMLLSQSNFIWQHISLLHTFITVWRLLVPISFITAAIAGITIKTISQKMRNNTLLVILICYITVMSTILNWANRKMVPPLVNPFITTDAVYTEYFEPGNPESLINLKKNINDYGKIIANSPSQPLQFLSGKGKFEQLERTQVSHEYVLRVTNKAIIRENTDYFPGWEVSANNTKIPINYNEKKDDSFGKITFTLNKGLYLIDVNFTDTPLRSFSKAVSTVSLIGGIFFPLIIWIKKNKKTFIRNIF